MRSTWTKFAMGSGILAVVSLMPWTGSAVPPGTAGGVTNFQASFMTWDLPKPADMRKHNIPLGNKARIQIDAWITVTDETTGKSERYVLIAPCRTEWVYAADHLFQSPSNEYRVIFSLTEQRSVGRGSKYDGATTTGQDVAKTFRSLQIDLKTFPPGRQLRSGKEINDAISRNWQVVGRTEFRDPKRKEKYLLEYPIKTMNFRPESASFQVDTGPLLVPDFQSTATKAIDRLEMAHVAYNRLDKAEFILRSPVEVGGGVRVLDYSQDREYPAKNELFSEE